MYRPSELFQKAYDYCARNYDHVAILSAKYGLLLPDEKIDPYDLTLKVMSDSEQIKWAEAPGHRMLVPLGLGRSSGHAGLMQHQ